MLSTKDAQRHTPGWLNGEDAPVFLIRAGSVIERALVEAELSGEHQAGRVFQFELVAALRSGVEALADEADRDQLLAVIAADAALEGDDELPKDEAALLVSVKKELAQHWPDYRGLMARVARRKEIAPIIALQRFLVGWERVTIASPTANDPKRTVPLAFEKGPDGRVPLSLIARIDQLEMLSAGNFAYGLLYPGDLEGNSLPLSPSDESPPPLTSDTSQKAVGKSMAKSGRKTPASRSRRGSGA